jgi:hypothetical protein
MPDYPLYQITHQDVGDSWNIDFTITEPFHTLDAFPHATTTLTSQLPIIMKCDCYNEGGLPFSEEVKHTETGHLLEHILLEYLCQEKLAAGYDRAEFCGNTSWNWVKEKRGCFHITINKDVKDSSFFMPALKQSLHLLNQIMHTNTDHNPQTTPTPLTSIAHGQSTTNRPPKAA